LREREAGREGEREGQGEGRGEGEGEFITLSTHGCFLHTVKELTDW